MWWDVLVPKIIMEERLQEVGQQKERLRHRLEEIENSLAWRIVLRCRRLTAKLFPDEGRLAFLTWALKRVVRLYLERGLLFLAWRGISFPGRVIRRRLFPSVPRVAEPLEAPARAARGVAAPASAPPSAPRFRIYTNSQGNYFFNEMRDLLAAGLGQLGCPAEARAETDGFGSGDDWHVIIAPHEFFYLGAGLNLAKGPLPTKLILVNTEQAITHWFHLAARFFPSAHAVWDIDYLSAERLLSQGIRCGYLPLGYLADFRPFQKIPELPLHYGTQYLPPEVRRRSTFLEPLTARPLDVVFFGNPTARRKRFFTKAAPLLARYHCYFHFSNATQPLLAGKTTYMDTPTVLGLVQRSRVLLNIHRDDNPYFEWQRIVMQGIWQGALVISEPCTPAPPFRPGLDFIEADLADIPEKIAYYLSCAEGRREAQWIAAEGFRTLSRGCQFVDVLKPLVARLLAENPVAAAVTADRRAVA